ncbi:MAG: site-specific integrase [Verrucomicrobiota bacterium]
MKQHVFKRSRMVSGVRVRSKTYSGRYRFDEDLQDTEVSLGVTDKQVALSKLAGIVLQVQMERHGLAAPSRQVETVSAPLKGLVREWVVDLAAKGRKPHYCGIMEKFMGVMMRECPWSTVADIRPESFNRWRSRNLTKSAKTLNEYLGCVRAFLNSLVKTDRLPSNALLSVGKVETRGRKARDRRPYSHVEFESLMKVAPPARQIVYALAYYTGLRRSEIASLVWGDFDLESGWVTCTEEHTKNRENQPLPLPADLREMLVAHWETSGRPGVAAMAVKVPHRMEALHRDLKAAGIAKKDERGRIVDFHSFRHSFAQRLKEAGIPFAVAMRMMRHSDPKLLASVYGDQDAFALADFAAKLPGLSNGDSLSPDSSLDLVGEGLLESQAVASAPLEDTAQVPLNELLSRLLSQFVAMGQMAPAVGIEPTT